MSRILAIDYGMKRIGMAMTDALGASVQPLPVLENTGPTEPLERICDIVVERAVSLVLLGLPLNMDDSEGPMAQALRKIAASLSAALAARELQVEVQLRDERLTSWSAEREILSRGERPWDDKGRIDTRAAMLLLEDYLSEADPRRLLLPEPAEPEPAPDWRTRRKDRGGKRRRGR